MPPDQTTSQQDAFRTLWMDRLNQVLPLPTSVLVGSTAYLSDAPWRCLGIGLIYVAGNMAIDRACRRDAGLLPEGVGRHVASMAPAFAMAWVAGTEAPGWLLGIIPCFVGALGNTRKKRSFSSLLFVSSPAFGIALAGYTLHQMLPAVAALAVVTMVSAGLFEIMHAVWQQAEARREDLARTADALRVAARTREAFLANITHELRTPMNGVLGATELLIDGELAPKQRELARVVQRSGWGLLQILDDILDTTRMASQGVEIQSAPLNPQALAEAVISTHQAGLSPELTLSLQTHGLPSEILGDAARLRQVLFNLIGNAVKFTEEGRVVVDLHWRQGSLEVSVQDTGPGIALERQATLMEAFTQEDSSWTRKHGGVGLGLHLCNGMVRQMGGALQLTSTVGKGCVFHFKIPAPLALPAAAPGDGSAQASPQTRAP